MRDRETKRVKCSGRWGRRRTRSIINFKSCRANDTGFEVIDVSRDRWTVVHGEQFGVVIIKDLFMGGSSLRVVLRSMCISLYSCPFSK